MRNHMQAAWILPAAATVWIMGAGAQGVKVDPWANSSWAPPPGYQGPVFKLNHDYPTQLRVINNPPWISALGGKPISADNAIAYVQAVKDYITSDMRTLILDYPNWNAQQRKWYNLPWLFSIRDPVHGTYVGTQQDPTVFPLSNMKKAQMTDYVLVYYNDIAGYTLGQLWGPTALQPDLSKAQFQDGAIIIKAAFTDATAADWSPLAGAPSWELFPPVVGPSGTDAPIKTVDANFFQFDIIVKDTKTAPLTGWVFATLVYDKSVPGDGWTRMIPLGAMWGNDPNLNSVITPNAALQESVINPMAPLYSIETLGYGGRLSGPNDGAVSENNIIGGQLVPRARISSCMSCHGVAEYPLNPANLLPNMSAPAADTPPFDPNFIYSYVPRPGTVEFNHWFQDRPGTLAQDPGTVPLDYDMNIALKALPLWKQYTNQPAALTATPGRQIHPALSPAQLTQTGRPIRPSQ